MSVKKNFIHAKNPRLLHSLLVQMLCLVAQKSQEIIKINTLKLFIICNLTKQNPQLNCACKNNLNYIYSVPHFLSRQTEKRKYIQNFHYLQTISSFATRQTLPHHKTRTIRRTHQELNPTHSHFWLRHELHRAPEHDDPPSPGASARELRGISGN